MKSDDDLATWEWNITDDAITWSEDTHRIFGLASADTPIGLEQYLALTHPDDRETIAGAVRHTLETGVSFAIDHRIVRPDGSVRFLQCRGALVTDAVGRPLIMRGTVLDITARPRGLETILLVDNQKDVRRVVRRVLETRGYHVLEAASGHDALRLTVNFPTPIHLLVTDVVMPGMSGREVSLVLAPEHPTMKTLYLSGYADESIVRHGLLEPGVAFLQKPFTTDALARKVREVLDAPPAP